MRLISALAPTQRQSAARALAMVSLDVHARRHRRTTAFDGQRVFDFGSLLAAIPGSAAAWINDSSYMDLMAMVLAAA